MKKLLWILVGIIVIGGLFYLNQPNKTTNGKRNVYAVLPLTGSLGSIGEEYKTIIEFAKKENNYPFEIIYVDSESAPTKGLTALQSATVSDDRPIVFSFMSSVGSVIAPYIDSKKGFLFAVSSQSIAADVNSYQQVATSISETLDPLVSFIKKNYTKLNVIYTMDEYGLAERNYLTNELKKLNYTSISELALPANVTDPRNEVVKILSTKPEAILILGNPTIGYINLFKHLKQSGYNGAILADATLTNPSVQSNLGEYANGTITVSMLIETETKLPAHLEQLKNYIESSGIRINSKPIQMLDTLELIKYTIDNNLPFERKTYNNLTEWKSVSGNIIQFKDGLSTYPLVLCTYQNGKFFPLESETK